MAHELNRLTARGVATASNPGLYADGAGLYLRVGRGGAKSWVSPLHARGVKRARWGSAALRNSASQMRVRRLLAQRALLAEEWIHSRGGRRKLLRRKSTAARSTFDDCASAYIKAHEASWRNAKHRQQWENTLTTYVTPVLRTDGRRGC